MKILILFLPTLLLAAPSWLYNLQSGKNEIIAYGIDESLSEAKQNAISDISNTLSVSVNSSVDLSKSDNNGALSKRSKIRLKTHSDTQLSGVKFIKIEQKDGLWYVAAHYDNSPLSIKLKRQLPDTLTDETQNRYLQNTPLIRQLNSVVKKKLNYKIIRKDNLWQLNYRDIVIPIDQDTLYKLFSNQKSSVNLTTNQDIYHENDVMYFNIKQAKKGYISLLYVEHNGKVGVLLSNQKSEKSFQYPDLKSNDAFTVTNPYSETIKELYVAILSQKPLDLHDFEYVSDNLLDESNYTFDKLILKLDNLDFSTFVIKIKK